MMPKSIPLAERFARFVVIPDDPNACWGWSGNIDSKGYARIAACGKSGRCLHAHRVSYALHVGPIPPGMHVLHSCDNPRCTNPAHLWLGTHTDNMRDKEAKGRGNHTGPNNPARGDRSGSRTHPENVPRGERSPKAKLTAETVRSIRARYATGSVTLQELADEFGVVNSTIFCLVRRRSWAHVE